MKLPRIYLAIDNCFASKRWTKPTEWMEVIRGLGINYIEASADTECDPLYMGEDYIKDWIEEVLICSKRLGMSVVNLYSGHGTYTTLGLAHTDYRIRDRFSNQWLKPMVDTAGRIGAGLGFFCHAFSNTMLQDTREYNLHENELYNRLSELSMYAADKSIGPLCVEQMYTPHQLPWTISGAEKLIKEVFSRNRNPLYITIDTGHQTAQKTFMEPDYKKVFELLSVSGNRSAGCYTWLGSNKAYQYYTEAIASNTFDNSYYTDKIIDDIKKHPYLFAKGEDSNLYTWLEKLGCYSPIIHLQQTAGNVSSHLAFTEENNITGIVSPKKVLKALLDSYTNSYCLSGMPPVCENIYLTLEIFSRTTDINFNIIQALKESVEFWRIEIPEDGVSLDELI